MALSIAWLEDDVESAPAADDRARDRLAGFRRELYRCLTRRGDELAELADAVLCAGGPVRVLAELSLVPEHRRGHGALYDALNSGQVQIARLGWSLAALPLPAWPDGRIRLAVDVSGWLRPDAVTSPERLFCHCYGRGKNSAQMIPGWPYSFVAALERGRSSWTALLDAVRLGPADDLTAVTAAQVREVTGRIIAAGYWRDGDPDILVIFDAGYEPARLAWLLKDLPVQVLGRLGSNRVLHQPPPPREPGQMGRPLRHGVLCRNPAYGLICWFTLGARAHPTRLPVHSPRARLAGPPGGQRCRQGRGDLGPPPRGRGAEAAGRPPETGLG